MRILLAWIAQFVGKNAGMEKVAINFSNEMISRGHDVTLMYCTEKSGEIYTPIKSEVRLVNLLELTEKKQWESIEKKISAKLVRELLRIYDKEKMLDMKIDRTRKILGGGGTRTFGCKQP